MGQYSDLTDAAQASPASATALGARLASETPPDRAAQALQMARRYGLPAGVAETFVDDYKARATMEDNRALLERAPRLQSWVDRNPMRAAASQDDMPSLAEVERRIAQFGELKAPDPIKPSFSTVASGLFESFTQGFRMMREGARMQAGDMLGLPIEDAQRRYEQARARADASRPEFESSTARGLYGGGESLARMLPSAAAAIALRNPALGLVSAGAQTQTEAYGKYRTRGATAGEAALGSFGEGAVEVATEKIPMGFLVDRFGKAGAKEFLAGMLLREMPTEQVATLLQDAIDTAVANPDKTWGEYFAERPEAAYQTALGVLVQSSFFGAANTVARRLAKDDDRAQQAEQTALAAEELSKIAEASKLRGRDAESFREFVQQVADEEGDAPTEFYIDGAVLANTLNQSGVTMQELEAIAPVVASQLEAAMTGGDVRVPVSEFLTAGEALTAPLVDHLRMTPDGMSRAEAQDYMKEQGDRIQREVEAELQRVDDQAQFRQSIEAVRSEFEAELGKAKRFTADVNRAYADLLANFYGATAARLWMTPQELLAKYRLRVQSKLADGQMVMEQGDTPEMERERLSRVELAEESYRLPNISQAVPKEYVPRQASQKTVRVYRGVPASIQDATIRPGDWVTLDRKYAQQHGTGETGASRVISIEVPADNVVWAGTDMNEWFYAPRSVLSQGGVSPRAQISLPASFDAGPAIISLLENADLSSFLHESGHLFLEIQADLAIKIQQQISAGASVTAGERQIVEDMNRLLEWFGVKGVEQASGATGGALEQPAFHGTPHRFDKFTTEKIGTGEGAQAYGWGLYFADKREIAEHYRNTLSQRSGYTLRGKSAADLSEPEALVLRDIERKLRASDWPEESIIRLAQSEARAEVDRAERALAEARAQVGKQIDAGAGWGELRYSTGSVADVAAAEARLGLAKQRREIADGIKPGDVAKPAGQLYEVEVPEDDTLLLWDKPLSEQPEKVREAFPITTGQRITGVDGETRWLVMNADGRSQTAFKTEKEARDYLLAQQDGAAAYLTLSERLGSDKAASEALMAAGIKGIKYLDGTSRGAGEGTYNYVIFSGDDVAIRQTFYQGGPEGVPAEPSPQGRTPLETWALMSLEEKRPYHEQFARGFEAYAFEGKAPSLELQSIFQRFRSWLLQVYQTLRNLKVELNDDVRAVMGRMLASDFAIEEAEAARNMGALFKSAEQAGMTLDEFNAYQELARGATENAIAALQARGLKDMKWLSRAKDRALKARQQEVEELRREVRQEVRGDVMREPVYRAWQFLTGKQSSADKISALDKPKSVPGPVDNTVDSMFVAIAKMGGLRRDASAADLGIDPKQRSPMPLFGKPLLLRDGGLTQDAMAERLGEQGYLTLDENGKVDIAEFQEKFQAELRGIKQYSYAKDYADAQGLAADAGLNIDGAERGKLDLSALIERYGPADARIAKLKALRMTAKAGWDFDAVAESFGFDSGDALVTALTEATPPAETIEARTDQRMLEMFGDITSPQALQRAADEAVHNEARARVIAAELKALQDANSVREDTGKRTKQGRKVTVDVMARAAKDYAQQIIGRLKVREIRPAQYASAEARNAKLAEKALASGKTDEAAMHKRNQLVNNHATKAAYEAQAEVKQIQAYFRRFEKRPKSVDPGYLDQIDGLLERFDFRNASLKEIDRRKSFKAWYDEQVADGNVPTISDELLDEANRKSFKDMTLEELRGLRDAVKNIEHLGKLKNRLLTARDQRTFDAVADEMAASIRDNGGKERPVQLEGEKGFRYWLEGIAAMHRKLSSLFRQMDGGRDDGPMYEHIVRGMNERGAWEDTRIEQATVALSKLYAPLLKMRGGVTGYRSKVFIPEIKASLTRGGRLAVALNWGNADNRQRILDGDKWTEGQVRAILGTLTAEELNFVNGVWEFIDSYWPEIAAKEKRLTGVEPEKVQAEPFTVQSVDGVTVQMRGGYYPLKYDTDRSDRAESQEAAQVAKEMMRGAMTRATTRRGHTKERVKEVKRAVRKDLGVITQHVKQVVHDLAWHEWLIDTNRLLRDERVVGAIREHYGPKVLKTIRDDVAGIATADVLPMTDVDKALLLARANVSRATMGASVTTAFLQPFGLTQSMARIGSGHVLRGAARWMGDAAKLESSLTWIREKSEFMRLRSKTFNRELREVSSAVEGKTAAMRAIDGGLFWLMQKMQLVADVPTWIGQYEKTLAQYPEIDETDEAAVARREAEAVSQADRAVIEAQGSGQPKDLAEIQRKYPLLTQFYSYFSVTANLIAEKTATTDFKNPRAVAGWLGDMALLAVIPAIVPAMLLHLLRGGGEDDDAEEWAKHIAQWQVGYLLGAVVGLRELSGAVQGFDYSGPPVGRIVGDITKAGKQTAQGEVDEPMVLAYVNLLGTALGIPVVQLTRSYRGWKSWDEGEAGPQAILLGPPPKE